MEAELYEALIKSKPCMEALITPMNSKLTYKDKSEEWKISKTTMMEKKRNPTERGQLRLIQLTNSSYNIYMTLTRKEIETRMNQDDIREDTSGIHREADRL